MKYFLKWLTIIITICISINSYAVGMRYLTKDELPKYDQLLKDQGHSELRTIVAVYDDSFNPPRVGLKCVNRKGQQYQVYIIGEQIKKIVKIK